MHKGACVADNTFFRARELGGVENGLQCLLANNDNVVTSAQGKWLYPDGSPVNCDKTLDMNTNPFGCSTTNMSNGVTLFKYNQGWSLLLEHSGRYTCCLPGNCSNGDSSRITVRIFG